MNLPFSRKSIVTVTLLFAASAIPAFANHGGGGGGGFHGGGGGGFHSGGGGSFHSSGGGGFRGYSAPAAGYGAARRSAPSMRSGGAYMGRPGGNSFASRPGGNFNGAMQRPGNFSSAPRSAPDGQWHSFGEGRATSGMQSQGGAANSGSFRVFSGNRSAGSTGAVRSFSGQGREVFENSPAARNVVPNSQSLSTIHSSFAASSALRSNSAFSGTAHFGGSNFATNRGFSGGVNSSASIQQLRGGFGVNRFGFGRGGFGRGCWNCGFGFNRFGWGFGWGGWGWPWIGFGIWDPFWYDSFWGWPPPAYGYYAYPDSNVYGYPDSGYSAPDESSAPPQDNQYDQYSQSAPDGNWATPNGPSPSLAPNSANLAVPVLIYLKNGAVLTVRDYWMIDGDLHYILMNGQQRTTSLEVVDLPRTNTENAKSGVKFIFKSEPSVIAPEPDGIAPPPAQPNSGQPSGIQQPVGRT